MNTTNNIIRQIRISHPTGKMEGVPAITSSLRENPICAARAKNPDSICSHCYAAGALRRYKNARNMYQANTDLLTSGLLEPQQIPVVNSVIARFETHGDLVSSTHARNYIRIARLNPWCQFTLFTKNINLISEAIKADGKPDNLLIVFSSWKLNEIDETWTRYKDIIDKVFTVYDAAHIESEGVEINCGAKSCNTCRKCYSRNDPDFFIFEKLK